MLLPSRNLATTNAAAQVTQIEYYPASHSSFGRPKVVTDASGMKTYYEYNALGLQTRMWGDSPTPEERVYDSAYGQLIELRTFRGGTIWSNTSWPGGSESPDKAAWNYDAATGLLISKLDASNRGYTNLYQYNLENRLTSLVWKNAGTTVASFAYTLGPTGLRTSLAETVNGTSRTHTWAYNSLYRLTSQAGVLATRGWLVAGAYLLETINLGDDLAVKVPP